MTPAEIQRIRDDLGAATMTLPMFLEAIRTKRNYKYMTTPWYRALMAVGEPKTNLDALLAEMQKPKPVPVPPPPPPPPPPPDPPPPVVPAPTWTDGFASRSYDAWAGGNGGRAQACDCIRVCPGGTPDTADPLDAWVAEPDGGQSWRVQLRPECKSLKASCLNACELVKSRPTYDLDKTEFLAHRMMVETPYVGQVGFCLVSQFGYPQVKYNALGLNLLGDTLALYCNLGYSDKGSVAYTNPDGYSPRGGAHPVDVGDWHDYVWELTYANVYGAGGLLRLHHRKPGESGWAVLFDSRFAHPGGVPTRQWGYGLGNDTAMMVDVNGTNVATGKPQLVADKLGAYRGAGNENVLSVRHRKFCQAASFASAVAYLDAPG